MMIKLRYPNALSIAIGVTALLVLFEGIDVGSSLIERSSMYIQRAESSTKKGLFKFIREGNSFMPSAGGLYIDNATAKSFVKYMTVLVLFLVCAFTQICTLTFSKLWPVGLKDIYLIYYGQPGSILNLAYKCSLAKVKTFHLRFNYRLFDQLRTKFTLTDVLHHTIMIYRETFGQFAITSFGDKELVS